ncbi:MAG: TetR/AcrR family transcriptional regulator; helix-turn-helix transcriptional regulator [Parvularculaceae bacterium]|nr:TetR/AcrR family transcriptional regulator; helix-turn-helix transcriptional regulator [Parvularculaceae bacterium]
MRVRLCEAAARRLAAAGYHRTSIQQVVEEAGASPGALLHHFPSKEDLIAATAAHLLTRSVKWFARAKADLGSRRGFAAVIRRSWKEQFQSPEYAALLEILLAARTEPTLAARLEPLLEAWRADVEAELTDLLPSDLKRRQLDAILTISRCLMTGLVVQDSLAGDRQRMEASIDAWLELLEGPASRIR